MEEDDAPHPPHAGEVGVGAGGATRAVDGVNAGGLEFDVVRKLEDGRCEGAVGQRRELVDAQAEPNEIDGDDERLAGEEGAEEREARELYGRGVERKNEIKQGASEKDGRAESLQQFNQ